MLQCCGIQVISHISIVTETKILCVQRCIFTYFSYLLSHICIYVFLTTFWVKKLNRFLYSWLIKTSLNFSWIYQAKLLPFKRNDTSVFDCPLIHEWEWAKSCFSVQLYNKLFSFFQKSVIFLGKLPFKNTLGNDCITEMSSIWRIIWKKALLLDRSC